jgi:signal peptidase I
MGAPGIAKDGVVLGEDEFFVLGDNRAISKDSRSESVGVVPLSRMGGKMIFRIFPFNKFGTVNEK